MGRDEKESEERGKTRKRGSRRDGPALFSSQHGLGKCVCVCVCSFPSILETVPRIKARRVFRGDYTLQRIFLSF